MNRIEQMRGKIASLEKENERLRRHLDQIRGMLKYGLDIRADRLLSDIEDVCDNALDGGGDAS